MIFIACILMLGIGAVLIWAGYMLQNSVFMSLINISYAGYIIIACGAALILVAFLGCIGAWKNKKLLLCLYIMVGIIISILLIAFGAVIIYARTVVDSYLGSESKCQSEFGDADSGYTQAGKIMCTVVCPCAVTNSYVQQTTCTDPTLDYCTEGTVDIVDCNPCLEIQNVTAVEQAYIISWIKTELGLVVTPSNCVIPSGTIEDKYLSSAKKYLPLLKWIEESFSCSGLCVGQTLYYFSDINNGQPSGGCLTKVHDWAMSNFLTYGIVSIVLGSYLVRHS